MNESCEDLREKFKKFGILLLSRNTVSILTDKFSQNITLVSSSEWRMRCRHLLLSTHISYTCIKLCKNILYTCTKLKFE